MEQHQVECPDKVNLSQAVVNAVSLVYSAKSPAEKMMAREEERKAVAALDNHLKDHGCAWPDRSASITAALSRADKARSVKMNDSRLGKVAKPS